MADCGRETSRRGLCASHYKKAWKAGQLPAVLPRNCKRCGKEFTPPNQPSAEFCTDTCKKLAWAKLHPAPAKKKAPRPPRSQVHFNECKHCGRRWTGGRQANLCSRDCYRAHTSAKSRQTALAKHRAAGRVVRCIGCSAEYCPLYGCKPGRTPRCEPCAAAARVEARRLAGRQRGKKHTTRAKLRGLPRRYFKTITIFERDNWTCKLCGCKTPRELKGTLDPRAPELDHIIPFAAGGGHLPENCQCACRQCNGRKGAKPLGQLLMFG